MSEAAQPTALHQHLLEHIAAETELIEAYRELAAAPDTPPAARFLVELIVEDEQRHHHLFRQLAAALDNELYWKHDPEAAPVLWWEKLSPVLAEATDRFLRAEEQDRQQLRALRRELKPFGGTTLWDLLVEMMERDTDKHIRLLSFIRDRRR